VHSVGLCHVSYTGAAVTDGEEDHKANYADCWGLFASFCGVLFFLDDDLWASWHAPRCTNYLCRFS
jgi:hypothetical protein